jgi:hypothetical protein
MIVPEQGEFFGAALKLSHVTPSLVISCRLSKRAKKAADILGVDVRENVLLKAYPMIKCDVAPGTREKIYHLPFDQQYDRAKIFPGLGECYVDTVAEAEQRGFRRARRWRPPND